MNGSQALYMGKGDSFKLLQFGVRRIVAIANACMTTVDERNPSFVTRVACVSTCSQHFLTIRKINAKNW